MIHYKVFQNQNSVNWITFVHGFGGNMSFWKEQIPEFQKHFNLLLIDLRGHGESKNLNFDIKYSLELFAEDILQILDHLKIQKTHFVGLSFGSIIINIFETKYPSRVSKIVFTGAILRFNPYLWFLLNVGRIAKFLIGYNELLKVFAKIVMNTKNQDKMIFYVKKEGKSLGQIEFNKWYVVVPTLQKILIDIDAIDTKNEKLYIMGEEDKMFLPFVEISTKNKANSKLIIVENCGHIVNLEKPEIFNNEAIKFLLDT